MRIPLLLMCAGLAFAASRAEAALPTVGDPTVTQPTPANGTATIVTTINPGNQLTEVTLKYGLANKLDKKAVKSVPGDAVDGQVSFVLSDLVGGKTYDFKIIARNASSGDVGVEEPGQFESGSFPPTAIALPATGIKGGAVTLNGTVTSNRSNEIVTAFFRFQSTSGVPVTAERLPLQESPPFIISRGAIAQPISFTLSGLDRSKPLYYRVLVLHDGGKVVSSNEQTVTLTNRVPAAREDIITFDGRAPVVIDVLANDRDRDGDELYLKSATKPERGKVSVAGNDLTLTYAPDSSFTGTDEFTYVVEDGQGGSATGTVKIRSPLTAVAGLRGGLITDANGDSVGLLRIRTGASGAFTGKVHLNGKSYTLIGTLDINGHFKGTAHGDDGSIAVEFSVDQESGATLLGSLDGDRYQLSLEGNQTSETPISELEGRYTVELPGGSGTSNPSSEDQTTPGGVGWAIVEINEDGYAEIKGKLADGSGFSTTSVVSQGETGATLPFYAKADQSIVVGTLEIGETITGTIEWKGEAADSGNELETTITAGGSRYFTPNDGRRALEIGDAEMSEMSLTLSGGNLPTGLPTRLRVSEGDDVQVQGNNFHELEMEIDRKTGRFNGGFTHPDDGDRRKFSGVLNQANGGGKGLFPGLDRTGTVELSVTATIDPGNPTPEPEPPTPDPTDPIPTEPDPFEPEIVNFRR